MFSSGPLESWGAPGDRLPLSSPAARYNSSVLLEVHELKQDDQRMLPLSFPPQVVHAQSVVLGWKLSPRKEASFVGQLHQGASLSWWTSATVHIDNRQISYTAEVGVASQSCLEQEPAGCLHLCLRVCPSTSMRPFPPCFMFISTLLSGSTCPLVFLSKILLSVFTSLFSYSTIHPD